ncbi:MAG: polyprenyl synthetase family protein, partial [Candidatus Promineifilaceae bacterium]
LEPAHHLVVSLGVPTLFTRVYDFIEETVLPPLAWSRFEIILKAYRARRATTVHAYVDTLPVFTCMAAGGSPDRAIPLSAAWVFYIFASYVLDDLQDDEGQEQPWYGGVKTALPLGFFALGAAKAALAHLEADEGTLAEILGALGNTMALAATAQSEQLTLEELTVERYFKNLAAKAGLIFATGAWAGARLATSDSDVLEAFYQYGLNMGMGGQITDDCLDLARGDLANKVFTLPIIYALSQTRHSQHSHFVALLEAGEGGSDGWIAEANEILEAMGAIEWSLRAAKAYAGQALAALEPFPEERVRPLIEYVTKTPPVPA